MKWYEVWEDDEDGLSISALKEGEIEDEKRRGLIPQSARLRFRLHVDTYEEALAVRNIKLGWAPYVPEGKPAHCPNGCGGVFYPAGYCECPNCGVIGEKQRLEVLRAQEQEDPQEPGE